MRCVSSHFQLTTPLKTKMGFSFLKPSTTKRYYSVKFLKPRQDDEFMVASYSMESGGFVGFQIWLDDDNPPVAYPVKIKLSNDRQKVIEDEYAIECGGNIILKNYLELSDRPDLGLYALSINIRN